MKVSTITVNDIIPQATKAVQRFIKGSSISRTLPYFGSHITLDDLVMETAEKVVRANPMYLTKSYVWTAAKCVCIDKLQQKKLPWAPSDQVNPSTFDPESGPKERLEELLEGDAYDHTDDILDEYRGYLSGLQNSILDELLTGKMYIEVADTLDISLRTLERQVQEIKWFFEFLCTGMDPADNKVSTFF